MDVVVDGLMVTQSRIDPDNGSEDLKTVSWVMNSFGGIIGSIVGGLITQYSVPRYCFYLVAALGLLIMIQAFIMSSDIEMADVNVVEMSLC